MPGEIMQDVVVIVVVCFVGSYINWQLKKHYRDLEMSYIWGFIVGSAVVVITNL